MIEQRIISVRDNYIELDKWLEGKKKVFLVCDGSIEYMKKLQRYFNSLETELIRFSDFRPNPLYESAVEGVRLFRREQCEAIMAVGGGSAMDVAKCIKLYSNMDGEGSDGDYLKQKIIPNDIPFLVMPTTAGTGSEATRYAVIYYDGVKQNVTDESCIPGTVIFDPDALKTLPLYQKKATMMDALCHAIESFWSVNSTHKSREYSGTAIKGVLANMDGYLANTEEGNAGMLWASYTAGKAINIAQTTAGHAMCYKITSLFMVAHGHAAILCNRVIFRWMLNNIERCIDPRGKKYLICVLDEIGQAMGCKDGREGAEKLNEIYNTLKLYVPTATAEQYEELKTSVNPARLKNHPLALDVDSINTLYHEILR